MKKETYEYLEKLAQKTIDDCTYLKEVSYHSEKSKGYVLLPSGDEKYISFWIRDAAMMAQSHLIDNGLLKNYIKIIMEHGQNSEKSLYLKNDLIVPPYAVADHINYDAKAVFYPGTYDSGDDQGCGDFGFYPPFCDNYYYVLMVYAYIMQSNDKEFLEEKINGISVRESIEFAFSGYNIDEKTQLCESSDEKYTVDWGFVDTVKKSGKLAFSSLLRYNACKALEDLLKDDKEKFEYYRQKALTIKNSIIAELYDEKTGWLYSATKIGKQYDVWATAYAVFSGVLNSEKTLKTLYDAYLDKTAVVSGYVRHLPKGEDFSDKTMWEFCLAPYNTYQNGAYWATPTGWYAYALYKYSGKTDILDDFAAHTKKYEKIGSPFEWINDDTTNYSGLCYGTSGVLPYIGAKKIIEERF